MPPNLTNVLSSTPYIVVLVALKKSFTLCYSPRASRDGTLRATNLADGFDNSLRSLQKIFLDYIGIIHIPRDQVEHQSLESRSAVENHFFSSVNFYALHSKSTIKIKSTYIRVGQDVTRAVLDSFHKKTSFNTRLGQYMERENVPLSTQSIYQRHIAQ